MHKDEFILGRYLDARGQEMTALISKKTRLDWAGRSFKTVLTWGQITFIIPIEKVVEPGK